MSDRIEELRAINDWRDLKPVAEKYGYQKPDDVQWKDEIVYNAIAAFMELESRATQVGYQKPDNLAWADPQVEAAISELETSTEKSLVENKTLETEEETKVVAEVTTETKEKLKRRDFDSQDVKGLYCPKKLKKRGIKVCSMCGSGPNNDPYGQAICPENFSDKKCPRLKAIAAQLASSSESEEDVMSLG